MNQETLRLRMFAGPNGSGKSTFKSIIRPELLGVFVNPESSEGSPSLKVEDKIQENSGLTKPYQLV